ncbi:hypothetical protein [Nitratireductor basaltis]|uniref:Uncharacterized protein n=1 Tax=Nitratireductor basaltis TaxID=472175 RepID=A0A084UDN2_9HYPH|nr:hypothetical protein [Nitratireductor basaltis]KFB11068.1 hypothetical protein EL18_02110 [Nitratireductor basaltis]
MSQFKPISEWIAEGVNPVGYVDDCGRAVTRVVLADGGNYASVGATTMSSLSHPVAPPAQKRLSDEALLVKYRTACSLHESREVRTQILARMKGPTRGEVETALEELFGKCGISYKFYQGNRHVAAFLSMFPEGE